MYQGFRTVSRVDFFGCSGRDCGNSLALPQGAAAQGGVHAFVNLGILDAISDSETAPCFGREARPATHLDF